METMSRRAEAPIRIYVGTDTHMGVAERALENSIYANTTGPVEITWMRANDPADPRFCGWDIGRPYGEPYTKGWATDFSAFRWFVPELAGFTSRAIYLDADMIALGDLREVWDWPMTEALHRPGKRGDVILWDCAKMDGVFPPMDEARGVNRNMREYREMLPDSGSLPGEWDHIDHYEPGETKLIHFSNMACQPWKPWPSRFKYQRHRDLGAVAVFWEYAE